MHNFKTFIYSYRIISIMSRTLTQDDVSYMIFKIRENYNAVMHFYKHYPNSVEIEQISNIVSERVIEYINNTTTYQDDCDLDDDSWTYVKSDA